MFVDNCSKKILRLQSKNSLRSKRLSIDAHCPVKKHLICKQQQLVGDLESKGSSVIVWSNDDHTDRMMHLQPKHTAEKMVGHAMMDSYSMADENATIISKDWTHLNLSVNSDEINKMPSPFEDIGFLATDNAPSRSINMKGSTTPWDKDNSNNGRKVTPANKSIGTGPSLNDFLKKEKESISQQMQQKTAVHNDIVSRCHFCRVDNSRSFS